MKKLRKTSKNLRKWLGIGGCLAVGIWLRAYKLGANSLWKDEIFSLLNASRPLSSILFEKLPSGDRTPILYIFIRLALLFGKSEFILRLPSVIFGVSSIILIYELGKLIFNSKRVGLVSAFLLAISPLHLAYSREVRQYSLVVFFSSLTLLFFYKMISEKKWRWLALFCLTTVINIATHPTALLVLTYQVVFLLFWGRRLCKLSTKQNFIRNLVLIAPLIVLASILVKGVGGFLKTVKFNPDMQFLKFLVYVLESLSGSKLLLIFYLVFFFLGLGIFFRERKKELGLLLLPIILLPLILYFFRPGGFGFHIRYVISILVPYLLVASFGIIHFLRRDVNILIAVIIFALLSVFPIKAYYQTKTGDWRGAAAYIQKNAQKGDVVVTEGYYNKILIDYYLHSAENGFIIKTTAESLPNQADNFPFRRYFHQHDYITPEKLPNPESLPLIDFEKIVSFDPDAEISPMYLFISQPVWVWQEGEVGFFNSEGWNISDFWGQKIIATDALASPGAVISYVVNVPADGHYNFYANLRWDGARGLLSYKIDNRKWSKGFRPFYGAEGDVNQLKWKEKKLGTYYLNAGEHIINFANQESSDGVGRYQDIDYFYLTLND